MMARLSYQRELFSWSLLPVMLAAIESGTITVFVKKSFAGVASISSAQLDFAVALVAAAKAIGMLTSLFWAGASRGRPKVRWIGAMGAATAICVATIATVPRSPSGLWTVVIATVAAWMLWSGVVTLRAGVWRANYRSNYRGSVFGKLTTINSLVIALVGTILAFCLDQDANCFRWLFPLAATLGAVGAISYWWVPFRRERHRLSAERFDSSGEQRRTNLRSLLDIVRQDRWFRRYLICMFIVGTGNLMLQPILAIVLADQFNAGYVTCIAITTVIPLLTMTTTLPAWSRLLARRSVIRYRAMHTWVFVCLSGLTVLAVFTNQIGLLFVAAIVMGIGWGGGAPAWNLGHQQFAPRERDAEYIAIHITLNGVRGAIGPLFSVWLYSALYPRGLHVWAFATCMVVHILAAIGFAWVAYLRAQESERLDEADDAGMGSKPSRFTRPEFARNR